MGRVWRKEAKKQRRKRKRQCKAKLIEQANLEKENTEEYRIWLAEQNNIDAFKKAEEERIHDEEHEKWLRTELIAQQEWRQLQEKIAKARFERAQQDLRIKKEWEEQQNKIKEAEEQRRKVEEEQLQSHRDLMKRIDEFASGRGELPIELLAGKETNSGKELCPFYAKTGACRFGDSCSRNHRKPGVSKVLLATNFYSHFGLEHSTPNEYDNDILLEYEDKDTYKHYEEFFNDVVPEFQQSGRIVQFKVCCNYERHLRGNTYIEFASLPEAICAYRAFHGRWYGGKQISLQFTDVPSWKRAICGLFAGKRCPKGRACNFLHIFCNPGNMFNDIEHRNLQQNTRRDQGSFTRSRSKENHWRWSESPPITRRSRDSSRSTEVECRLPRRHSDRKESKRIRSSGRSKEKYHSERRESRSERNHRHHKAKRRRKSED